LHLIFIAASAGAIVYGMAFEDDAVFLAGIAGGIATYLLIRKRLKKSVCGSEKRMNRT
jgi:hypothetical protein